MRGVLAYVALSAACGRFGFDDRVGGDAADGPVAADASTCPGFVTRPSPATPAAPRVI